MNKADSVQVARGAIEEGLIMHFRAPNGDQYTVGPYTPAVKRAGGPEYVVYGYGRSRWLVPERKGSAWELADFLVEHVGRGAVTQTVRSARERSPRHMRTR